MTKVVFAMPTDADVIRILARLGHWFPDLY